MWKGTESATTPKARAVKSGDRLSDEVMMKAATTATATGGIGYRGTRKEEVGEEGGEGAEDIEGWAS